MRGVLTAIARRTTRAPRRAGLVQRLRIVLPIGTFVELRSGRLAMVIDQSATDYAKPTVRTFYSIEVNERVRQEVIDLANCYGADAIVGLADLSRFEPEDVLELRQRMLATLGRVR